MVKAAEKKVEIQRCLQPDSFVSNYDLNREQCSQSMPRGILGVAATHIEAFHHLIEACRD